MAEFLLHDSLQVLTQNGECQIDLCFGDITKLKREDKVDVLMISAFMGDYSPTPTSVIGALKRSLKLNVRELARNKAEDLRRLYSCWWSQPLPDEMPYRRLLCFETKNFGMGRPQELVANVYRCLVPILNNEDGTVITPLLNTGDQGYGQVSMLQGMVVAAVNWMKAGLPLRLLKIVLYAKITDGKLTDRTLKSFKPVCQKFAELKERYDSQYLVPKPISFEIYRWKKGVPPNDYCSTVSQKFDVYLSFSEDDKGVVESIQKRLRTEKADIKIFGEHQEIDKEEVWQKDMYQVMMRSSRVLTVLSPNYLKSTACIEQYNIALCCNRRAHRDMLAPIYVDTIDLMPTYMGLVQYVDCRPNDSKKIHEACTSLLGHMTVTVHLETLVVSPAPIQYDIFVSYSHRDDVHAKKIVKLLQKLAPKLRIFFDIQELKTGTGWQRTLYHSIDGSRCLLALITDNYIKSPVCQEEYNLALAKHCSGDGSMQLIPLCLEELKEVPATFSKVKMIKATLDIFESVTSAVCKNVTGWLTGKQDKSDIQHILKLDENPSFKMTEISEDQRRENLVVKYGAAEKKLQTMKASFTENIRQHLTDMSQPSDAAKKSEELVHIVFSCAQEDRKYAIFLKAIFKEVAPNLVIKTPTNDDTERLTLMDTAQCVIAFLSPSYLDSPEQVEEFHVALCRQRISEANVLFSLTIHPLPTMPTYFHLVPCAVNIADSLWVKLAHKWNVHVPLSHIDLAYVDDEALRIIPAEIALGLHEAASLIAEQFAQKESDKAAADSTFTRPVLHNVLKIQDEVKMKGPRSPTESVKLSKILTTLNIKTDEVVTKQPIGDATVSHEANSDATSSQSTDDHTTPAHDDHTAPTQRSTNPSPAPESQIPPVEGDSEAPAAPTTSFTSDGKSGSTDESKQEKKPSLEAVEANSEVPAAPAPAISLTSQAESGSANESGPVKEQPDDDGGPEEKQQPSLEPVEGDSEEPAAPALAPTISLTSRDESGSTDESGQVTGEAGPEKKLPLQEPVEAAIEEPAVEQHDDGGAGPDEKLPLQEPVEAGNMLGDEEKEALRRRRLLEKRDRRRSSVCRVM